AGAVDADFGTLAEADRLRTAAGGIAAVEDRGDAHADLEVGDAVGPEAVNDPAQDLALLVAAIAMARGRAGLAAGKGDIEGDIVAGPEGVGLVVAHFDAAAAVAGAEAVGGDVLDLRTLQPGQVRRRGGAFHHEGRLENADVEMPVRDADVGDRHLVEQ